MAYDSIYTQELKYILTRNRIYLNLMFYLNLMIYLNPLNLYYKYSSVWDFRTSFHNPLLVHNNWSAKYTSVTLDNLLFLLLFPCLLFTYPVIYLQISTCIFMKICYSLICANLYVMCSALHASQVGFIK